MKIFLDQDFSRFVAHASKEEKERVLKKAADKAMKEQRKALAILKRSHVVPRRVES